MCVCARAHAGVVGSPHSTTQSNPVRFLMHYVGITCWFAAEPMSRPPGTLSIGMPDSSLMTCCRSMQCFIPSAEGRLAHVAFGLMRVCHSAVCFACARVCVRACVRACGRACVRACVRACACGCVRACVRARVRPSVRPSVRACVLLCVCVCVRVCVKALLPTRPPTRRRTGRRVGADPVCEIGDASGVQGAYGAWQRRDKHHPYLACWGSEITWGVNPVPDQLGTAVRPFPHLSNPRLYGLCEHSRVATGGAPAIVAPASLFPRSSS